MTTKEEPVVNLLKEAIELLKRRLESLAASVTELKSSVEFLDENYEDVLSQLQLTNKRVTNHTTKIKEVQLSDLANVKKDCHSRANTGVEDLA